MTTKIKHKYSEDVPVHIKFEMGGKKPKVTILQSL